MTNPDMLETVVENGCCIGCGVCAASVGATIQWDDFGRYRIALSSAAGQRPYSVPGREAPPVVCPFADGMLSEDQLAEALFGAGLHRHPALGLYQSVWAGSAEEPFRLQGSSGGMVSWLCRELLSTGEVDGVVSVRAQSGDALLDGALFRYQIGRTVDELRMAAKSRYYPVELSRVLDEVREGPEASYVLVGLPCFVKAVRLLARVDPVVRRRVRYTIGLVCGHLKSSRFADMLAWQCGIVPGELRSIDFRVKNREGRADQYGITVSGCRNGEWHSQTMPNRSFYGQVWGLGFLKYNACDYCDDVFAETADICVGDAWLAGYVDDPRGTNVLVVRGRFMQELIQAGIAGGTLLLEGVPAETVARSQDAGLRHRRDGLAYRLHLRSEDQLWAPRKRVTPSGSGPRQFKRIHELRIRLAKESHLAFEAAVEAHDFDVFRSRMDPLLADYGQAQRPSLVRRSARFAKRLASSK